MDFQAIRPVLIFFAILMNNWHVVHGKAFLLRSVEAIGQLVNSTQQNKQTPPTIEWNTTNESSEPITENLLEQKANFILDKLRAINEQIGTLAYPTPEPANTTFLQQKITYLFDKYRQLSEQFAAEPVPVTSSEEPSLAQRQIDFVLQQIRTHSSGNRVAAVQDTGSSAAEDQTDSWEDDDFDEKPLQKELTPEKMFFYVLEVFGSLTTLILGAIGQISLGGSQVQNATAGVTAMD